mgnify:CR=1 FL=1
MLHGCTRLIVVFLLAFLFVCILTCVWGYELAANIRYERRRQDFLYWRWHRLVETPLSPLCNCEDPACVFALSTGVAPEVTNE